LKKLKSCNYFNYLSNEQYKTLSSFAQVKHYNKGSILFYEKELPTSLTLLTEGILKVYKTDPKNNEIIMHRFKAISMIAEMAVLEGVPFPASAAFETDGTVIEINFERFKKEFFSNPDIALTFFKSLSKKIKHLENVIALNLVLDSTARLAKFIYENDEALKKLKKFELAKLLNMTPETLSRTFKKLIILDLLFKDADGYNIKSREGLRVLFE